MVAAVQQSGQPLSGALVGQPHRKLRVCVLHSSLEGSSSAFKDVDPDCKVGVEACLAGWAMGERHKWAGGNGAAYLQGKWHCQTARHRLASRPWKTPSLVSLEGGLSHTNDRGVAYSPFGEFGGFAGERTWWWGPRQDEGLNKHEGSAKQRRGS